MNKFQRFSDYKAAALQDPEVRAAYEAMAPEFELAKSMIRARLAKKLTQKQLAEKAGVSQTVITRLESGDSNPTFATINRVAQALGKELRLINIR